MKTTIDFDRATSRFVINAPMWLLDAVRAIPNRRFNQAKKVWTAPALRMNVAYLRERFPFSSTSWTEAARDAAEKVANPPKRETSPFPRNYVFKTEPMPKQKEGLDKIWSLDTPALFMAMGSGKTKVAIDLFSAKYLAGEIDAVIVLCPVSIKQTWARTEIQKHSPIPVTIRTVDLDKKNGETIHVDDGGLKWFIVGIESIQSSTRAMKHAMTIAKTFRCATVVDESSKIKNAKAIRAQRATEIGKEGKYRMIMTGTPVTQGIIDLYMQFEFLDTQIIGIGDEFSFRNRYCVLGGYENKQIVGYTNVEELMEIIKPFVFQVTKEEAMPDLPPKVFAPVRTVALTAEQKRMYKEVKSQLVTMINGKEVSAKNVLDKMRLLQQIECGFYSTGEENEFDGEISRVEYVIQKEDPKIEELLSLLEESGNDESVIVWCRYRNQLSRVVAALREKYGHESVVEFHGGRNEDEREEAKLAFQKRGEQRALGRRVSNRARFMVATQSAGGMGQTWTAATLVIYMSNTFSLDERLQSEDRPHRFGQTNIVTYVDIAGEGTVGVHVIEALLNKKDFADFVKEKLKTNPVAVVEAA